EGDATRRSDSPRPRFHIPEVSELLQPPPQPLTIKGCFSIFTFEECPQISQRDFYFYDVSAEISGLEVGKFQVLHYAFPDDVRICCCTKPVEGDSKPVCDEANPLCPAQTCSPGDPLIPNCDATREKHLASTETQLIEDSMSWKSAVMLDTLKMQRPGSVRMKHLCSTEIQFSEGPLIVAGTTASVRVIVKSFEGAVLWSKEYRADDPLLGNLCIEVPVQKPVLLTPLPARTNGERLSPKKQKKLRGQVLELSKKCKLKDLTVVIQAKARGDTLWRIVSAGRTDSAGNFSLPYPFGVFDEAQALVSAMPNSPATVKRTVDETIAEDFL